MIRAIEIADSAADEDELLTRVLEEYKQYNVVHTINNAALCLAAIRFSKENFEKALTLSVIGGMDTDCNGATVGSVWGHSAVLPVFLKNGKPHWGTRCIPDWQELTRSKSASWPNRPAKYTGGSIGKACCE